MKFRPLKALRSLAVTASVTAALVSGVALAGEKIRVAEEPEPSALPPAKGFGEGLNRPFEIKRSLPGTSDVVPIVPITPPNTRSSITPRIEKLLDEKKNWIFTRPSKRDPNAELEEIFGIHKDGFEGIERKKKSTMERYFEAETASQKDGSSKFFKNENRKESDLEALERRDSDAGTSALPLETDLRTSMSPAAGGAFDSLKNKGGVPGSLSAQPEDVLPRNFNAGSTFGMSEFQSGVSRSGLSSGAGRLTGPEQGIQEYQKLFSPTKGGAGLFADPINLHRDGTRQVLNPIVGGTTRELGAGLNSVLGNPGASALPAISAPSPFSAALSSSFSPGASLGPSIIAPLPAPRMQARPPVLEIPRRSF